MLSAAIFDNGFQLPNQIRKKANLFTDIHTDAQRGFPHKSHRSPHPWYVCSAFAPDAASPCHAVDFVFRLCDLLCLERRFRLLSDLKKGRATGRGRRGPSVLLSHWTWYQLMTILMNHKKKIQQDIEKIMKNVDSGSLSFFRWHPQCHHTTSLIHHQGYQLWPGRSRTSTRRGETREFLTASWNWREDLPSLVASKSLTAGFKFGCLFCLWLMRVGL